MKLSKLCIIGLKIVSSPFANGMGLIYNNLYDVFPQICTMKDMFLEVSTENCFQTNIHNTKLSRLIVLVELISEHSIMLVYHMHTFIASMRFGVSPQRS